MRTGTTSVSVGGIAAATTLGVSLPSLSLFAVSALAPFIVDELDMSRSQLGGLTTALYATAAVLSLFAGQITDRLGGRRALLVLFVVSGIACATVAGAPIYLVLLVAMVITGMAQSLANPATNTVIATSIPKPRQGLVVGVKQSGAQLGALIAGAVLTPVAAAVNWRAAVVLLVGLALVALLLAVRVVPVPAIDGAAPRRAGWPSAPNRKLRRLMVFMFFIGCGNAATNTYLPLYAHDEIGFTVGLAGAAMAVYGAIGIGTRIAWSSWASKTDRMATGMGWLAAIATVSAALMAGAAMLGTGGAVLLWAAILGLGASAVGANAISMLSIVRDRAYGPAGHASALASLDFFAGFVVSPPVFGAVVDASGRYQASWWGITVVFAAAAISALALRRTETTPLE